MKRWRYLLQFCDRCPGIETADDLHEFQVGRVKLMPGRMCRKGISLEAWWSAEAARLGLASGYR